MDYATFLANANENVQNLRSELNNISIEGNWLDQYEKWRTDEENAFDSLLQIKDSFNTNIAGDSILENPEDESSPLFFDSVYLSVFYSTQMLKHERWIVRMVQSEVNPEKKQHIIEEYFAFVEKCKESKGLALANVTLYDCAEQQMVLHGKKIIDTFSSFVNLLEIYQYYSVESIFLLFTHWRITQKTRDLKRLLASVTKYIRTYFEEDGKDPDAHMDYPIESQITIKQIGIIEHWLEIILIHTKAIFEKYQELGWLLPIDRLVDSFDFLHKISKYDMLRYKLAFSDDNNEVVRKKAVCNHAYGIWIKSADVFTVMSEMAKVLFENQDEYIKKLHTTQPVLLEVYDNLLKVRDEFVKTVFYHRAYYEYNKSLFNSAVSKVQEENASHIHQSIDDVIQIVNGINSNDIEALMQAKSLYVKRNARFFSEDQNDQLDALIEEIIRKIKESISKLAVYEELYASTTDAFKLYSATLMRFPQIFSSLVSAEYLYNQYITNQEPRENFDYSCISIMYYMALEDFVNKLIYTPYAIDILDPNSNDVRNNFEKYISHRSMFYDNRNHCYKRTCEIGTLGILFQKLSIGEENLEAYLNSKYPGINISKLITYGGRLCAVAPRRNDAAHGGNLLSYNDVTVDKAHVYENDLNGYRGLIFELFKILFPAIPS